MDGKEQHEQLSCDVCGSCDFQLDAGFYFCQECGTQQQGRRETIHEMEMGRAVGAKIGKSKKKRDEEKKQREKSKMDLELPIDGGDGAERQTELAANENVKTLTALFPCAKFYSDSTATNEMLYNQCSKRDQHGLLMEQTKSTKVLRLNDVPISPILLHKQLKTYLERGNNTFD